MHCNSRIKLFPLGFWWEEKWQKRNPERKLIQLAEAWNILQGVAPDQVVISSYGAPISRVDMFTQK